MCDRKHSKNKPLCLGEDVGSKEDGKDDYEAYSSQSYQLGNFDYEVLVFRKPRN